MLLVVDHAIIYIAILCQSLWPIAATWYSFIYLLIVVEIVTETLDNTHFEELESAAKWLEGKVL